jgi:hypothetical protein
MWFEHTIPAPERLPDVPIRLGDCIGAFLSGTTTRIDVHVRAGTGWQKVNAVHLEQGDVTADPQRLAAIVKVCADHHAAETNAAGQYRAMIWRYCGGELERRKAAFDVALPRPAPPPRRRRPPARARSPRDLRRTVLAAGAPLPFDPLRAPRTTALDRMMRELAELRRDALP